MDYSQTIDLIISSSAIATVLILIIFAIRKIIKENIAYGNTIVNILDYMGKQKYLPGTTSMAASKKSLKARIKSISRNKKFTTTSIVLGIIIILSISIVGLTSGKREEPLKEAKKTVERYFEGIANGDEEVVRVETTSDFSDDTGNLSTEYNLKNHTKINLIDVYLLEEKDDELKVNIYFSYPREGYTRTNTMETIIKKESNVWKIQKFITFIDTPFLDGVEEVEDNFFYDYVVSKGYSPRPNTEVSGVIWLPEVFDEEINGINVGKLLKECNDKSKGNGLDFSEHLFEPVLLVALTGSNGSGPNSQYGSMVGLIKDKEIIGFWFTPIDQNTEYLVEHVLLENLALNMGDWDNVLINDRIVKFYNDRWPQDIGEVEIITTKVLDQEYLVLARKNSPEGQNTLDLFIMDKNFNILGLANGINPINEDVTLNQINYGEATIAFGAINDNLIDKGLTKAEVNFDNPSIFSDEITNKKGYIIINSESTSVNGVSLYDGKDKVIANNRNKVKTRFYIFPTVANKYIELLEKNGDVVSTIVDHINYEKFYKFLENNEQGISDEINIVHYTLEGAPIIYNLRTNNKVINAIMDYSYDGWYNGEKIQRYNDMIIEEKEEYVEQMKKTFKGYYLSSKDGSEVIMLLNVEKE